MDKLWSSDCTVPPSRPIASGSGNVLYMIYSATFYKVQNILIKLPTIFSSLHPNGDAYNNLYIDRLPIINYLHTYIYSTKIH